MTNDSVGSADRTQREIVDECENCGQETEYRCTRMGHLRVCEGCYTDAMELMP